LESSQDSPSTDEARFYRSLIDLSGAVLFGNYSSNWKK
jgi:hypothetical protein